MSRGIYVAPSVQLTCPDTWVGQRSPRSETRLIFARTRGTRCGLILRDISTARRGCGTSLPSPITGFPWVCKQRTFGPNVSSASTHSLKIGVRATNMIVRQLPGLWHARRIFQERLSKRARGLFSPRSPSSSDTDHREACLCHVDLLSREFGASAWLGLSIVLASGFASTFGASIALS